MNMYMELLDYAVSVINSVKWKPVEVGEANDAMWHTEVLNIMSP